jgi:hypothetical protein
MQSIGMFWEAEQMAQPMSLRNQVVSHLSRNEPGIL